MPENPDLKAPAAPDEPHFPQEFVPVLGGDEFDDVEGASLQALSPEQQRRLKILVIGVNHQGEHFPELVRALTEHRVDYLILEGVMDNIDGFTTIQAVDREYNEQLRDPDYAYHAQVQLIGGSMLTRAVEAVAASPGADHIPIVRSMDVNGQERSPHPDYASYDDLFRVMEGINSTSVQGDDLFLRPSHQLHNDWRRYFELRASLDGSRENIQRGDASRIAASAVMRHDDGREIVVGVVAGGAHALALSEVVEGTEVRPPDIIYVPESERQFSQAGIAGLARRLIIGETAELSEARLNRVMLGMLIYHALARVRLPASEEAYATVAAFVDDEEKVSDELIAEVMQDIDGLKDRIPQDADGPRRAGEVKYEVGKYFDELSESGSTFGDLYKTFSSLRT